MFCKKNSRERETKREKERERERKRDFYLFGNAPSKVRRYYLGTCRKVNEQSNKRYTNKIYFLSAFQIKLFLAIFTFFLYRPLSSFCLGDFSMSYDFVLS